MPNLAVTEPARRRRPGRRQPRHGVRRRGRELQRRARPRSSCRWRSATAWSRAARSRWRREKKTKRFLATLPPGTRADRRLGLDPRRRAADRRPRAGSARRCAIGCACCSWTATRARCATTTSCSTSRRALRPGDREDSGTQVRAITAEELAGIEPKAKGKAGAIELEELGRGGARERAGACRPSASRCSRSGCGAAAASWSRRAIASTRPRTTARCCRSCRRACAIRSTPRGGHAAGSRQPRAPPGEVGGRPLDLRAVLDDGARARRREVPQDRAARAHDRHRRPQGARAVHQRGAAALVEASIGVGPARSSTRRRSTATGTICRSTPASCRSCSRRCATSRASTPTLCGDRSPGRRLGSRCRRRRSQASLQVQGPQSLERRSSKATASSAAPACGSPAPIAPASTASSAPDPSGVTHPRDDLAFVVNVDARGSDLTPAAPAALPALRPRREQRPARRRQRAASSCGTRLAAALLLLLLAEGLLVQRIAPSPRARHGLQPLDWLAFIQISGSLLAETLRRAASPLYGAGALDRSEQRVEIVDRVRASHDDVACDEARKREDGGIGRQVAGDRHGQLLEPRPEDARRAGGARARGRASAAAAGGARAARPRDRAPRARTTRRRDRARAGARARGARARRRARRAAPASVSSVGAARLRPSAASASSVSARQAQLGQRRQRREDAIDRGHVAQLERASPAAPGRAARAPRRRPAASTPAGRARGGRARRATAARGPERARAARAGAGPSR